jgi:hypothetical protein
MIETADAPLRAPHAVIPHGQMEGDEGHAVVPAGQMRDGEEIQPPDVTRLEKMFDESRDLTDRSRREQQIDQDYYDGPAQLNAEIRTILKTRGQPPIFDNRIAPAIDGILGVVEGAKVDPRAYPRNPEDQGSADIVTKSLRFIADICRWQQTKLNCAEDYLKQGLTAAIVEWDGKQIKAEQIRWETFFYDPKSRKHDFSDAKYKGIAKWMYADEVRSLYPERATALGDICTTRENSADESWDDRPTDQIRWVDKRRNRVLVVEIYYQHGGEWLRCVFCAAGWLEYSKSPYVNVLTGETRCPIEAQSFKIDRENNRYGPIRNMRPMQDEVNARRSRGLHLLNTRQIQNVDINAPPVDADLVRQEMSKADGIIPQGWQAVQTSDMAAGNLQMLSEAKDSLSRMVPVALAQDLREGSASSGRARQVAQQAGLTQFGRGFGRLEDFEERIFRQFWMAAQQFWTGEMSIRVTDNPRAPEFMQINVPVMGMVMQPQPAMGPDGQPMVDPATGQPMMQNVPAVGQVGVDKQIATMDMDIIIGTTPDTIALEQEVFDSLMELVRGGTDPFTPQFELLIEMSPLPDKVRILERLKSFREETQQAQAQQMQAQQEQMAKAQAIGEAQAQADIANKTASAGLTTAKTEQLRVETEKSALDALMANHLQETPQSL